MLELEQALKVLMVDDDPEDVFMTKVATKRLPIPIDFLSVNSGEALFEFIKSNSVDSVDLVLLDVNMPKENGYSVLKKLRANPQLDDMAVVMFSTLCRQDEKRMALKAWGK